MKISASFLAKARRDAENLMTDHCTVTRPGESTTDPDTGLPNTGTEQVYQGKCKVQTSGGLASEQAEGSAAQAMGAVSLVWSLYVHFPYQWFACRRRRGDHRIREPAADRQTAQARLPAIREDACHRLPLEREGGCMNATSLFDASELTAFADKLLAKGVARRAAITMAVKKGAQNVKNDLREDLSSSGNKAFRRIPITYTVKEAPGRISAEIGPTKGGAGSLANIAFFGTAKGGGTHRFYEHGEEELPKLAEYVARAAVEGF